MRGASGPYSPSALGHVHPDPHLGIRDTLLHQEGDEEVPPGLVQRGIEVRLDHKRERDPPGRRWMIWRR